MFSFWPVTVAFLAPYYMPWRVPSRVQVLSFFLSSTSIFAYARLMAVESVGKRIHGLIPGTVLLVKHQRLGLDVRSLLLERLRVHLDILDSWVSSGLHQLQLRVRGQVANH